MRAPWLSVTLVLVLALLAPALWPRAGWLAAAGNTERVFATVVAPTTPEIARTRCARRLLT